MPDKPSKEVEIDIFKLFEVMKRRKYIFSIILLGTLLSAVIFIIITPKTYKAVSKILVMENQGSNTPFIYYVGQENPVNNEIQVITSLDFSDRVAAKLMERNDLNKYIDFKEIEDFPLFINQSFIVEPIENSDVIKITAFSTNSVFTKILANKIAETAADYSTEFARSELTKMKDFLNQQIPIAEGQLKKSEKKLKMFKVTNNILSLSDEMKSISSTISDLDVQKYGAEIEYKEITAKLKYLAEELKRQKNEFAENLIQSSNPYISGLLGKLREMESHLSVMELQGDTNASEKVVLKLKIDSLKYAIKSEVGKMNPGIALSDPSTFNSQITDNIMEFQMKKSAIEGKMDAIKILEGKYFSKMSGLPKKEIELAKIQREYEIAENIYQMLSKKYEDIRIEEAGKLGNVRIVESAHKPKFPIKPKKKLTIVLALVIGIGFGFSGVIVLEFFDTTIKTEDDIRDFTELPVIGSIPMIKKTGRKKIGRRSEILNISERLITKAKPRSTVSESFRTLRTALEFSHRDKGIKSVVITSSIPWEGKSTISVNLAITSAKMGIKTILLDGDLRKPVISKIFGVQNHTFGLTEILGNNSTLEESIKPTDVGNLFILPAGPMVPNPAEFLTTEGIQKIMKFLHQHFDYVVIDSPPLLPVSDAILLGSVADGILITVRAAYTKRDALQKAIARLSNINEKIIGTVINAIPIGAGGYYSHYYHYYGYYGYYGKEKKK